VQTCSRNAENYPTYVIELSSGNLKGKENIEDNQIQVDGFKALTAVLMKTPVL
jgi:hypothetical protein